MNDKTEAAVACFREGFNCSQAVLSAWREEFNLEKETALRAAAAFGAGMGRDGVGPDGAEFVGGGRLLPEGWMAASTTVTEVAESEEVGYAAGWWVNQLPDGSLVDGSLPADAYWATGHDGQRMYVVPSAGLVVVRLGFSPDVAGEDLRVGALVAELVSRLG